MSKDIPIASDDLESAVRQSIDNFIITILKYYSDEKHPLSAKDISRYLAKLCGEELGEKAILKKLRSICTILENDDTEECKAIVLTIGGYICYTMNDTLKKPQYKFYFEPLVMPSDIAMLHGSITSNRYIRPSEREYLYDTLQFLSPEPHICQRDVRKLPPLPDIPVRSPYEKEQPKYLDSINTVKKLYDAILWEQQIELVYGYYTIDPQKQRRFTFKGSNDRNPYILNPYALFWNNGNYYLLATHASDNKPECFRVDHIVETKPHPSAGDEMCLRAPLPDELQKYFTFTTEGKAVFNSDLYTSVHPLLKNTREEKIIECYLQCNQDALPILVDTFGLTSHNEKYLQILETSPIPHKNKIPGEPEPATQFIVHIPNVEYESIKAFCVAHIQYVTVIEPFVLALEIVKDFVYSFNNYLALISIVCQGKGDSLNPFVHTTNSFLEAIAKMLPIIE